MNTDFLSQHYDLTEEQHRAAIKLLGEVSSAEARHPTKGQGDLILTIRGEGKESPYVWRKVKISLDGKLFILEEKFREPSVFDDVEDPDSPDPFDLESWNGDPPQWIPERTALAVREKGTEDVAEIDPILGILMNSAAPASDRVMVLANICAGAVRKDLEGGDLSPELMEAEVLRGTLGKLAEIRGVANVAELQVAMKMDELDTRYLSASGSYVDLADELGDAMPVGNTSAGRAAMIARFLIEGSRILLTAGVKPEEISVILQDGKLSKLAVVSSAVKRVHEDVTLNTESKIAAYRQILTDATSMAARKLQRKYGRHRFPPAPATMQRDGSELRIVFWAGVDQWESQIAPRLTMLNFDAGREDSAVTPQMVLDNADNLAKIFEVAVMSHLGRRAVLGVMAQASGQPLTRQYISSILPDLSENQTGEILHDLVRWNLVVEAKSGNQTVYKLNRKETNNGNSNTPLS